MMSKEKLLAINKLAQQHNLLIFSDEMYRYLECDKDARLPAMCDLSDNALSLGGLSKSFGLPGLRMGWLREIGNFFSASLLLKITPPFAPACQVSI